MRDSVKVSSELTKAVMEWSGLTKERNRSGELAPVFQDFRERAQRLHDMDAGELQYDFLRPME